MNCSEMTSMDVGLMMLFVGLGGWKLFELTDRYGQKLSSWIIKKVEGRE